MSDENYTPVAIFDLFPDVLNRLDDTLHLKRTPIDVHPRALQAKADEMKISSVADRARMLREIDDALHLCESPIEQTALYQLAGHAACYVKVLRSFPAVWPHEAALIIVPQVEVGPYRMDFLATFRSGLQFAIECDGEPYHDSERDQARDAFLLRNHKITVFRIAGKTIWRGPAWAAAIMSYVNGSVQ